MSLHSTILRKLYHTFWFFLVPAGLGVATVSLLRVDQPWDAGFIAEYRRLVTEQRVPAMIAHFILYSAIVYRLRPWLPGAVTFGLVLRPDLPAELRREVEAAAALTEETRQLLARKGKAIRAALSASAVENVESAMAHLDRQRSADPLVVPEFHQAFDHCQRLVDEQLGRWRNRASFEYAQSLIIAFGVALVLRAFVVEAFKIPTGSMLPTLQLQDHIFVNKLSYGLSLPFSGHRVLQQMPPKRGDVMVFKFPENPSEDFIKRVIALPGDVLEVVDGHPFINGWAIPRCKVGTYRVQDPGAPTETEAELFVEFLGNYAYLTQLTPNGMVGRRQGPYHVPAGQVYVLGDNRNNSLDSREWDHARGAGVPFENIKGKALIHWLAFTPDGSFTTDRLFRSVMGDPALPAKADAELHDRLARCVASRPAETTPPAPAAPPTPPPLAAR